MTEPPRGGPIVETLGALASFQELFLRLYGLREPVIELRQVMHWAASSPLAASAPGPVDRARTAIVGGAFYNTSTPVPEDAVVDGWLERDAEQWLVPTVRETADTAGLAARGFLAVPAFVESIVELEDGLERDLRARVGRRRHREIVRLTERAQQRYEVERADARRLRAAPSLLRLAAELHDCNRRKYGHRLNLYAEPLLRRLLDSPVGEHLVIAIRRDRRTGEPVQASFSLVDRDRGQLYLLAHGIRREVVARGMNLDIADTSEWYAFAAHEGIAEVNLGRGVPDYKRRLGATRFHVLSHWIRAPSDAGRQQLEALAAQGQRVVAAADAARAARSASSEPRSADISP